MKKLFNEIFDSSSLPEEWSYSIIIPQHDPNSYRAISLSYSLFKIFVLIVTSTLSKWCEYVNITDEFQPGFRKNVSIMTIIVQRIYWYKNIYVYTW